MAHTNTDETKKIALGSGDVYITEFTGTIPPDEVLEVEANKLGAVQGGATVEYKPKPYTASSDDGKVRKTVLTEEECTLKLGIITWCADTLQKLCSTGRVTEANGKRTIKIGGIANYDGKKYVVRFVHKDKVDGDTRLTIVGSNQSGFSLAYVKDKETTINPEFTCEPMDDDGTLVMYEEEILGLQNIALTLSAGSTTGKTKVATVSPITEVGNSLKYQIGASAISVTLNDVCTTGWTALTVGTTDITATAGQVITVVEVDSSNLAKKYGTVTVIDNIG